MLRRILATVGTSLLLASLFFANPVAADVWLEQNEHDDGYKPSPYHVHARVGANAYLYGNDCQYKDWEHDKGDTHVTSTLYAILDYDHDAQEGWTETTIYDGVYWIADERAELPDLEKCPF